MDILISGAGGLIGAALQPALRARGHHVRRLVRRSPPSDSRDIFWSPPGQKPPPESLEGVEAIIHLSGASIAAGRWTTARQRAILESRVQTTEIIASVVSQMAKPPSVFIGASAIGYYGNRGTEWLDETSASGVGFLAAVCRQWETAADPIEKRGVRVVHLRTGIVLSRQGGALKSMLLPFKLGLGGRLGDGKQYMSWISLEDLVRSIVFAVETPAVSGPVNGVAPEPVTNAEFTRTLGRLLHRPILFPVPAAALRLALGERADALLLASLRLRPVRLLENGFTFRQPTLESALREILGK